MLGWYRRLEIEPSMADAEEFLRQHCDLDDDFIAGLWISMINQEWMLLCPETISSAASAQRKSHCLRSSDGLRRLSVRVVRMKDSTKLWLLNSSRSRLLIPLTGHEGRSFSIFAFTFGWFGFMEIDFYFLAPMKINESLWLRFCLPAEATMWMFEI